MFDKSYGERRPLDRSLLLTVIGAGVMAGLLFLTKQNVGLIVAVAFSVFLVGSSAVHGVATRSLRTALPQALYAVAFWSGIAGSIALLVSVAVPDVSVVAFCKLLLSIHSKGSPLYAATRIVHDVNNVKILVSAFALAVLFTLLHVENFPENPPIARQQQRYCLLRTFFGLPSVWFGLSAFICLYR